MRSLKCAQLFTIAQRRKVILPLYRQIIKSCYAFARIDSLAATVIRAIIVSNFREHSNEAEIPKIMSCIERADDLLRMLDSANANEDVYVIELLRKAYGKEGPLNEPFVKAHKKYSEKIAGAARVPHRIFANKPTRRPLPDVFYNNAKRMMEREYEMITWRINKYYKGLCMQYEI